MRAEAFCLSKLSLAVHQNPFKATWIGMASSGVERKVQKTKKAVGVGIRVTRLGDFGQLSHRLFLAVFKEIQKSPHSWTTYLSPRSNIMYLGIVFCKKNGLGYNLGDFY
jgi:hypothetical protein